ncbi:MAG: CoA pyrophosphatase [Desulfarculaceae bacterium]|nr:CoA pyrophosphatase [Desulfarculaceae bacterium]
MDTRFTPRQAAVSQALCTALAKHRPARERLDEVRPASVLMPLWDDGDRVQVVFTKRTEHLPSHAGQVSFPGGMRDPEDQDSKSTALRETHEEVGVPPDQVELITRLDQVVTITGFLVTPFVGLVDPAARFEPNPVEVDHLVIVPLARMLDRASYQTVDMMWEGMPLRQVALYQDGDMIWGATMRILLNFLDAVGGASPEIAALAEGK